MIFCIIFLVSILYDFIGEPFNDFKENRLFSNYTFLICKIKDQGQNVELYQNKKLFVDITLNNIGWYKLFICGYCISTWCIILYQLFHFVDIYQFLEYTSVYLIVNTIYYKLKY